MSENNQNPGYEKSDVSVNKIALWGVIGLTLLAIILVFIVDFFVAAKEQLVYETQLRPESVAIRELRAREVETLNSYKVIDSSAGTYQIPIDRAIRLMADEAYLGRDAKSGK